MLLNQPTEMATLLPGQTGFVGLRHDILLHRKEAFYDHEQLPQFLPRTAWPTDSQARLNQRDTSLFDVDIDWNDVDAIEALHDKVRCRYRGLEPMPPYLLQGGEGTYDGLGWLSHVTIVHNVLNGPLRNNDAGLSVSHMYCLARIVSYGMYHSMTYLRPWHIPSRVTATQQGVLTRSGVSLEGRSIRLTEAWDWAFGMNMKQCRYGEDIVDHDGLKLDDVKYRVWARRWLVVPMLYGDEQWGMSIFDRQDWQLYIFDCGGGNAFEAGQAARTERIEACIHAWIQFWNSMCIPETFSYFVVPVTAQANVRESGLLCIMWLIRTLRDQVGPSMSTRDPALDRRDLYIAGSLEAFGRFAYPDVSTTLRRIDWRPDGCHAVSSGVTAARRFLRVLACNELGLSHHEVMTKQFTHVTTGATVPSALMHLAAAAVALRESQSLPEDMFWTECGGPQFALPQRKPIPRFVHDAERRWTKSDYATRYCVEMNPQILNSRGGGDILWPPGLPFTERCPVSRPGYGVDLDLVCIKPKPLLHDEQRQQFILDLQNLGAPEGYRWLRDCIAFTVEDVVVTHESINGNPPEECIKFQFCFAAGRRAGQRFTWSHATGRNEAPPTASTNHGDIM